MNKIIVRVVSIVIMTLLLATGIVGNILCNTYFDTITEFFHGESTVFEGAQISKALEQGDKLNREIEEEGIILFKNADMNRHADTSEVEFALPMSLNELEKVNVFGWSSTDRGWVAGSDGSCNANNGANKERYDSILDSFDKCELGQDKMKISYNQELIDMYEDFRIGRAERRGLTGHDQFFMLIEPSIDAYYETGENGKSLLENAKDFSETAIVVISRLGGENNDLPYFQLKNTTGKFTDSDTLPRDDTRTYLDISTEEEDLLRMVRDNFKKVVVIYNGCNNMNLNFLEDYDIDACLSVNGTGQSGVHAIPKILSGEVNPSGKSVQIQPFDLTTDPTFMNVGKRSRATHNITYAENIYVGYKWYETADREGYWNQINNKYGKGYDGIVQYPFGYGLSYTSFEWKINSISPQNGSILQKDDVIEIEVDVTNTGERAGKDIVQVYYTPPYILGGIEKAFVNLVAFKKTSLLNPGETERLKLTFTMYDMASYDCYDSNHNRNFGYELDAGEYKIKLMNDSHHLDDCKNAELSFNINTNIKFREDPTTANRVENRFTNYDVISKNESTGVFEKNRVNAYANCAIDGSDADQNDVVYLSRSDFAGSFPKATASGRSGSQVSAAVKYLPQVEQQSEMPKFNEKNNLKLVTKQDGSAFSANELKGGLKNAKMNEDLIMKLGKDYDDSNWDLLLNQMSLNEIQDLVQDGNYYNREVESIGKPRLLDSDGPSGLNRHVAGIGADSKSKWTMYSMPAVIAQSWNSHLSYSFGLSIAAESIASGNNGWYAPGTNMMRSPFCGRNSEYYSEDPHLAGIMAAESCRGAIANGMNVYLKHFAVNETESGRIGLYTWLTEQALRETYLKPFEIAVKKGKANGIMTSLNFIGSVWSGGNRGMTTEILRNEWGFRGSVVTDSYIAGTNDVTQGLYGGVTLYLGVVGIGYKFDSNNPTVVHAARNACKSIIYAWCNSYYTSKTHDHSNDTIVSEVGTFVSGELPTPYWLIGLVSIDVIIVGIIGVWTFLIFRKSKKQK